MKKKPVMRKTGQKKTPVSKRMVLKGKSYVSMDELYEDVPPSKMSKSEILDREIAYNMEHNPELMRNLMKHQENIIKRQNEPAKWWR